MSRENKVSTVGGFAEAYQKLMIKDIKEAKSLIMAALKINNRQSFYDYKVGNIKPTEEQKVRVERVFAIYGIHGVWKQRN